MMVEDGKQGLLLREWDLAWVEKRHTELLYFFVFGVFSLIQIAAACTGAFLYDGRPNYGLAVLLFADICCSFILFVSLLNFTVRLRRNIVCIATLKEDLGGSCVADMYLHNKRSYQRIADPRSSAFGYLLTMITGALCGLLCILMLIVVSRLENAGEVFGIFAVLVFVSVCVAGIAVGLFCMPPSEEATQVNTSSDLETEENIQA